MVSNGVWWTSRISGDSDTGHPAFSEDDDCQGFATDISSGVVVPIQGIVAFSDDVNCEGVAGRIGNGVGMGYCGLFR